jgi:hypothetical protein
MRSRRIVATKPRAVPRLALDARLGQTTALGALEPATRRALTPKPQHPTFKNYFITKNLIIIYLNFYEFQQK